MKPAAHISPNLLAEFARHSYISYEVIDVKPYNTTELCSIYGVTDKTFAKWIKPFLQDIGPKLGRYYTVAQVEMIFYKLGMPYKIRG